MRGVHLARELVYPHPRGRGRGVQGTRPGGGPRLNKFLKSAAFPILIVILLVFVAQRLVVSSEPSKPAPTFNEFTQQIADGDVAKATIKVENKTVNVTLKDKTKFTTGYPEDYSDTLIEPARVGQRAVRGEGHPQLSLVVVASSGSPRSSCSSGSGST